MGLEVQAGPDCPRCHARLRPGAPWCTQCYLDLSPAEPPPLPGVRAGGRAPRKAEQRRPEQRQDERRQDEQPQDERTWPCTDCGRANPLASDTCSACGQGFLAPLKEAGAPMLVLPLIGGFLAPLREAGTPMLVLPLVGDVVSLRPAQRLGLAGAVIALVALLTLLLGVLL